MRGHLEPDRSVWVLLHIGLYVRAHRAEILECSGKHRIFALTLAGLNRADARLAKCPIHHPDCHEPLACVSFNVVDLYQSQQPQPLHSFQCP
jgi:hypothetical protein